MRLGPSRACQSAGYTLLEVMIVVSILAIIASIGVPQYVSALRIARIGKAKHELVTISNAIGSYTANNEGQLPWSLYQVGYGGKQDPWGVPYCYLNYADGTGDGLEWAIAAGIVDPSAFTPVIPSFGGQTGGGGGDGGPGEWAMHPLGQQGPGRPIPIQSASSAVIERQFHALGGLLGREITIHERASLELVLMNNGSFSMFAGVQADTTRRRDRYMFPLNTDYDLFSLGPNHKTAASLSEAVGLDDVIRANNGGFFGVAADY